MNFPDFAAELRASGLVGAGEVRLTPLEGGISSDIFLIEQGGVRFVVKRALPRLRVQDEWVADVGRNRVEQEYLAYAASVIPGVVPRVLHRAPDRGWFAMEFVGDGLRNWKAELLEGRADPSIARKAGEILGRLHAASWWDPNLKVRFANLKNFTDLRIGPYLLSAAERLPDLRRLLEEEAARLARTQIALVHGDFSPKNMLVRPGRIVLLDAEVAWFGDPVFDAAFLLNHLHLKALVHAQAPDGMLGLAGEFWRAYAVALGPRAGAEYEARTARLLLCLLLARVHGKSPVEYLTDQPKRELVTAFVRELLPHPPSTLAEVTGAWRERLARLPHP